MYNLIFAFIAMFLFSACGNYNAGDKHGEGSISFSLAWEKPASAVPTLTKGGKGGFNGAPQLAPSPDVCVDYGLSTIAATVYDSANSQIASATWQCSAHSGSISGVPPGSGIWIRLEGKDSGGAVQWRGDKTGITVTSGQATSAGTVTMTYVGSDTTPPAVSSVNPTSSSVNVPVTAAISAVFSENMAVSSIGDTAFTLKQGTTSVSGAVSYDTASKTATFTPSANLAYSTAYAATITTGVKDMAGNAIANAYTWGFTTVGPGANFKMPDTNQTTCYNVPASGYESQTVISCAGTGQDGAYTINPPSYTDNGNGTITDNITGLIWQKQDDGAIKTWDNAMTYCNTLTLAGQTGWRLPSQIELISIIDNGAYKPSINATFFPGTISTYYWASTTYASATSYAWVVYFDDGGSSDYSKLGSNYARCVRGGQ